MLDAWDRLERWLIGLLGGLALCIYLTQIVGRYLTTEIDFSAGEELTIYVVIWATFLTASLLVREDGHVRADLLLRMMRPERQRWLEIANCGIALGFCLALTWYGWLVSSDSYDLGERSNTVLSFPMWVYYAALPFSAALMSIRYARRLWQFCFAFDPATMEVHSGRE
ncbi:MAG: TRAP transporter small permease subunit [Rhodospirillales bacterium]|nr:TRAP transporter small permease subunit [Rhodospirillales bacterium]